MRRSSGCYTIYMKHEQIILAGLGYVIGFITAFIGFGLTSGGYDKPMHHESGERHGYGLVEKMDERTSSESTKSHTIEDVLSTDDGLFVVMDGEERIVSMTAQTAEDRVAGSHYAIIETLVSPSGEYLFFCALLAADDTECNGYIYHARNDTLYPIKDAQTGTYFSVAADEVEATWTEKNLLILNGRHAASGSQLWMME